MDEFIALKCPECGGKIEVIKEKADELFVKTGDNYVFIGSGSGAEKIACVHCGTEFIRKQKVRPYGARVRVSIKNATNATVIVAGGNIVIGR